MIPESGQFFGPYEILGHLGAGEGRLDYPLYLSLLQRSGFDGTIVLHQMHHLDDAGIDARFAFVREQAPTGFLA